MATPRPRFVWYELSTTDPDAAEAFYRRVVGWSAADAGQTGMRYTVLSAGDRGIGGLTALPAEARDAGVGPGWLGYVGVADTDLAAKRIARAGGDVRRAPDDIPGVGRFAVVADPGGAVFLLLTPLPRDDAPPPADPNAPGVVGWHELYSSVGQEAAFAFYASQFGWETADLVDMGPMHAYRVFAVDGVPIGGMMDKPEHVAASAWSFYVTVDGLDAAVERIRDGGGAVRMGPHEVPGGRWIVHAVDPQGAAFALVSARR